MTDLPGSGESELLVEIAVIKMALPVHTDQLAAHHRLQIVGVVRFLQQGLIGLQFAVEFQLSREPLDGLLRGRHGER